MIFVEGSSALVRLADCFKANLDQCLSVSKNVLEIYRSQTPALEAHKELRERFEKGTLSEEELHQEFEQLNSMINPSVAESAIAAQGKLHSFVLTVTLTSCFCLESYVNALAFRLFRENDFLGLLRKGHDATADILIDAIDRMSTTAKWETLGKLREGNSFDRSVSPFQDLRNLFNFRNDLVHDKFVPYNKDRMRNRYGNQLPDPVMGVLELEHAVYAAETYWAMVEEVHRLTGYARPDFHQHYNLSPWHDDAFRKELERVSIEYKKIVPFNR